MRESLLAFLESKPDGAYFLGHSSALIKIGKELVLFDGVCGDHSPYENYIFHPQQVDFTEILPKVTVDLRSHCHADHWSSDILEKLTCPTYIMDGRPSFRATLAKHTDVVEVPRLTWHSVAPGVEVFFVPNPRNQVDSSCLVRGNGFTAYLSSDNFLDRNLCQKVSEAAGLVDVAFLCSAFIHYYPALMEMDQTKKVEEAHRLKRKSLDEARMFIDIVRPRLTIPFGNNLLYCEGPTHPLNAYIAKPEELAGSYPLRAGDYALKAGGFMAAKLDEAPVPPPEWRPLPPMDFAVELSDRELVSVISRVRKAARNCPGHAIVVNDVAVIDAQERRAYEAPITSILRDRKTHHFWFDAPVFHAWARGKIAFEAALGSRRFKYSRSYEEFDSKIVDWIAEFL